MMLCLRVGPPTEVAFVSGVVDQFPADFARDQADVFFTVIRGALHRGTDRSERLSTFKRAFGFSATSKSRHSFANAAINGNANIYLTPPKSGLTEGIVMFGDRTMPEGTA
jgi:hypothetical protein